MKILTWQKFGPWQDDVSWGTDTTYSLGSAEAPEFGDMQHAYTITDLTPNTKYYYQVADKDTGTVYGAGFFITAPEEDGKRMKFARHSDLMDGRYSEVTTMSCLNSSVDATRDINTPLIGMTSLWRKYPNLQ